MGHVNVSFASRIESAAELVSVEAVLHKFVITVSTSDKFLLNQYSMNF